MAVDYHIYKNVSLGKNPALGKWVELGIPPRGKNEGDVLLVIGDNSTIRSRTAIYAGSKIGNNFATGHGALIRENVTIGDNVSIGSGTEIEQNCRIGNNVRIHSQCFIAEGTEIGDNVKIAPGTQTASDRHPIQSEEKKNRKGPIIGNKVYVGMGATVLPSIIIGEGSFIGAGAVVTKDIPAGVVALGNPARVHMSVDEYLSKLAQV